MPEHDNILPERIGELEPVGGISVVRYRILAYKVDLTPITQYSQGGKFYEMKKALEWATSSPEHLYQFKIPVAGARLGGSLNFDIEKETEILLLSTGERAGTAPKTVRGLYAFRTDSDNHFNLYVSVDPRKTSMFVSNLVWVGFPGEQEKLTFNFSFNPGYHTVDEMADAIETASKRVNSVVNMILDGFTEV